MKKHIALSREYKKKDDTKIVVVVMVVKKAVRSGPGLSDKLLLFLL